MKGPLRVSGCNSLVGTRRSSKRAVRTYQSQNKKKNKKYRGTGREEKGNRAKLEKCTDEVTRSYDKEVNLSQKERGQKIEVVKARMLCKARVRPGLNRMLESRRAQRLRQQGPRCTHDIDAMQKTMHEEDDVSGHVQSTGGDFG